MVGFIACFVYENNTITERDPLNVLYGFFAALFICGAMLIEGRGHLRVPASLKLIGDASYSIYLVHLPALSALAKIMFPVWKRFPTPLIVPFLILAVLGTVLGLLVYQYVERPLLRWLSKSKPDLPKSMQTAMRH
jgi:peptidoglycan/LPS O-acetylase OafA/YrhL